MIDVDRTEYVALHLAIVAAVVSLGTAVASCGGSQKKRDSSDRVVGQPPSAEDDPFRIMNTPREAEEASSSGYIGEDSSGSSSRAEPPASKESSSPSSKKEAAQPSDRTVEASRAEPPSDDEQNPPPKAPNAVRCFSCVRICPMPEQGASGEAGTTCGDARDVICGWGVHEEPETARRLARAECDGALEMARKMKTWSRIEGSCPTATCRGSVD